MDNFSALREPGRSRSEYMSQLKADLATYYGYNDFMLEAMLNMFTVSGQCDLNGCFFASVRIALRDGA